MTRSLIVPGLNNSGPGHWQSWFEQRLPDCVRVIQDDWAKPDLPDWARGVRRAIHQAGRPVFIIAHSFGCLASIQAAWDRHERVMGALLVAPPDPRLFHVESILPRRRLHFPVILVGSENDEWMNCAQARLWADRWGAQFVNAGAVGHINIASGHGPWPAGLALFKRLHWLALKNARGLVADATGISGNNEQVH